MPNGATIFAVDSPRTVANLRKRLTERRGEVYSLLRTVPDWDSHQKYIGGLDEIDILLSILDEIEETERR